MEALTDIINGFAAGLLAGEIPRPFGGLLAGLAVLLFGAYLSGKVNRVLRTRLAKINRFDRTLIPVTALTARYGILIITVLIALANFGVETTSLIALLGAAGIAIGLALQGTLSNVAAGVMLLFLRPFRVGDWVETENRSGIVDVIGLFTTEIITFENVYISIPNSKIWGATITNHTRNDKRRMDIDIGIGYDSDLDLAGRTMLALARDSRVLTDPAPQFLVVEYADSAIVVRLRLFAGCDDYFPLHWDIMRALKPALDKAGIEIPFPQRVMTIHEATPRKKIQPERKPQTKRKAKRKTKRK